MALDVVLCLYILDNFQTNEVNFKPGLKQMMGPLDGNIFTGPGNPQVPKPSLSLSHPYSVRQGSLKRQLPLSSLWERVKHGLFISTRKTRTITRPPLGTGCPLPRTASVLEGLECLTVTNPRWVKRRRYKGGHLWKDIPEFRVLNLGSEFGNEHFGDLEQDSHL